MNSSKIKIELLINHRECIDKLAEIWHQELGKPWVPDVSMEQYKQRLLQHLNSNQLPLTFIALNGKNPIGMASLRVNEGVRDELTPWLGGLVVKSSFQKQGIGQLLIDAIKNKAKEFGYTNLHLLTFNPALPAWYEKLGWQKIGMDKLLNRPVTIMSILI